jgi:hypothetical protein
LSAEFQTRAPAASGVRFVLGAAFVRRFRPELETVRAVAEVAVVTGVVLKTIFVPLAVEVHASDA